MAQAAYPPAMDEQSLNAGILGLATHEMCGASCRHEARWALTPPFHPYSISKGYGAVIFCHTRSGVAAGFPLGNMALSVARDGTPGCVCKVNAFLSEVQATSAYHCAITLSAGADMLWLRPMGYKCGDRLR